MSSANLSKARALLCALPLLLLFLPASCGESARRPDVILVVIDTLRSDRLGCYGYERPTSPRLDRLAREGALFTDVTSQSGWTLPSMVSLLSGRYVTSPRQALIEDAPSMAETYQRFGYRTIGVIGNLSMTQGAGFERGFDHYDRRSIPRKHSSASMPPTFDVLETRLWDALEGLFGAEPARDRKPLFLHLQPFDPHAPYYEQKTFDAELASNAAKPVQPPGWHAATFAGAEAPEEDKDWAMDLRQMHRQRGFYDQEVRFTDEVLARVLDGLEQRGFLENAVVAVVADHGEGLWEHIAGRSPELLAQSKPSEFFYQAHGSHLYQEAIATPMILWGRGIPAGVKVGGAVENVDLYPTLLDLCSLPAPGEQHGRSLVSHLSAGSAQVKQAVFSFVGHQWCVREIESGLKLTLVDPTRREEFEPTLFHLPSDPGERKNLYASRPQDVERLSALLDDWFRAYPTQDSGGSDAEQEEMLRKLGYTEEDIGTTPRAK